MATPRYFSNIYGIQHASPVFQYFYDSSIVVTGDNQPVTGGMRCATPADFAANISVSGLNLTVGAVAITGNLPNVAVTGGSIQVSNTAPIPTSGVATILSLPNVTLAGTSNVNVTNTILPTSGVIQGGNSLPLYVTGSVISVVTGNISTSVNAVAVTGNPGFTVTGFNTGITVNVNITNPVLAVTGNFGAGGGGGGGLITGGGGYIGVTGTVATNSNITNTAPIAISGVVNTTVTVGNVAITGFNSTIAPLAVSGTFAATIENVAVTGGSIVAIDTGVRAVNVTNLAPIPISGIVTTSVTVGNVAITGFSSTIAPLAVSGVLSATVTSVAVTGNPGFVVTGFNTGITVAVSNSVEQALLISTTGFLAAISGSLASNLSAPAWVSGSGLGVNANITNTAPIAISGVVSTTVTVGNITVTGTVTDQITGWNTGIVVTYAPVSKTVTSNSTPSGALPYTGVATFFGQALAANTNRVMFFVQNIHTGIPLLVNLGATAAGTGAFSFILNPSATQGFGGSSFSDDHYRGAVQVSGGAWQAWEL